MLKTLVVLVTVLATADLYACSCYLSGGAKSGFTSADAVFVGEVVDGYHGATARLRVVESFKGPTDPEIEIVTAGNAAACGYGDALFPGTRHLIYTRRHEFFPYFEVSTCSRTKPVSQAAEELALLRSRAWWWRSSPGSTNVLSRLQLLWRTRHRRAEIRAERRAAQAAPRTPSGECFLLQPLDGSEPWVSDRVECGVRTAPASTFKIPHALIALDSGVVTDPLQPVRWDGSEQPFESWKRDHSLDSAVKWSALWFFRRTASLIGRERMVASLKKLRYADDTFEGELASFWVNGDLVVSPREQLRFLERMMRYELPVRREHVDAVKAAFLMPPGKLTNASGEHDFPLGPPGTFVVRAKTGNTRVGEERVSWLVGHLETGTRQYVFVSRVRSQEAIPGTAGAELVQRMLESSLTDPRRERRVCILTIGGTKWDSCGT
ncbi:MAG TPA: penicillin-binding transpeptidase domain-containing protein [Thermoanaerobaculia bacterium]|nr:penicillin-binding transpeptidase domain-containing protein [Thermoanaerobaculia bacterium]